MTTLTFNRSRSDLGILPISTITPLNQPVSDVYSGLIASVHKKTTQRTYKQGIKHFCHYLLTGEVVKGIKVNLSEYQIKTVISDYLKLEAFTANAYLGTYRNALLEADLKPNSINVKIASVKALVKYAFDYEQCNFVLDKVKSLLPEVYRDTKGTSPENIKSMLSFPNLATIKGKRDYAIFRLLWDCALRRGEVNSLNIEDFDELEGTLRIKGKGKLSKEVIYLSSESVTAIKNWLSVRYQPLPQSPLFISLDNATNGHRLSTKTIYNLVKKYSGEVINGKVLSPHQVRHSSITAVLDATGGNVRLAQKHSRHKNFDVLMRYDDNRVSLQKEAVNILANMVS
ncbi:tyrosine-type recombinase/integrase [Geminocystis sp. NIES-3709]|uniref:tyrosine-type recombinase/integrase n=1 Tax=Geminocystis sp. NIES-3709 TaxID=1617448 RepID=UPI0005FCB87C|nr:tyrosine-type recombinase/integrase [Geminocystis sp. NIES-3709]BAQ64599.1 tyrosine recombinase XerC [Geminocystis sp. NIES-3709]